MSDQAPIRYAFTPATLAEHWGVSAATVRNLAKSGQLRHFRIGRQVRIKPEWVDDYEGRQSVAPNPPADRSEAKPKTRRDGAPIWTRPSDR
jgi:excisionase family DNA binding protein